MITKQCYQALTMNDEPPTLYSLMESKINYDKENKTKIEDLPNAFRTYLFDFYYPIPVSKKEEFELLFLNRYMFRRIGQDTYLSFKIHLKAKLQTIMPKFSKLLSEFDDLDFKGQRETITRTKNNTRETESEVNTETTTNNISENKYADTPQGQLSEVQDGTYLTDYTYNTNDGTNNSTSTNNGSENGTETESVIRDSGDNIDEYIKFNEQIFNIYEEIFKQCDSLFYGLA